MSLWSAGERPVERLLRSRCASDHHEPSGLGTAGRDSALPPSTGSAESVAQPRARRSGEPPGGALSLDPEQRIAVEVTDMFGKRVLAQQYNNSGEVFNTILELDGLAAGIYAVNITINDRVITERITVQ